MEEQQSETDSSLEVAIDSMATALQDGKDGEIWSQVENAMVAILNMVDEALE